MLGGGHWIFFCLTALAASAFTADWPQLQYDAARGGCTPDSPQPPFKSMWSYDFAEKDHDKIHPMTQPVIYNGRVFVPSKNGNLYAIDAASGDLAWKWTGAGPIVNAAGCAGGLVIFGSLDGKVYALNAADGTKAWEFFADIRGFCAAPCLVENKVFIGSRSGVFYALDAKTGEKLWSTPTGGYVWATAAYADGRVFTANEEIKVVALDAANGEILWKTDRLNGVTFRDSFAFVDRGKVVVRTWTAMYYREFGLNMKKEDVEAAFEAGHYPLIPAANQDAVLEEFAEKPDLYRELYVFDAATGKELYVPVHDGRIATVDGPAFSVCRDARGFWYTPVAAGPIKSGWSTMSFARMDPDTGRLIDLITTPDTKPASHDEAQALTVGGDILFVSEQEEGECGVFCAMDLTTPKFIAIPSRASSLAMEYNAQPLCVPMAIAGKRFFKVTNHVLNCWGGE